MNNPTTPPTQPEPSLEEIRKRCEAATKGPWTYSDDFLFTDEGGFDEWCNATEGEKAFIAHARTDIPALIAMVEGLREALQLEHPSTCAFISQELLPCDCGVAKARHKAMHPPKALADSGEGER